jgi:MFS transporter, DHA3 family, tetracycline resistance protein
MASRRAFRPVYLATEFGWSFFSLMVFTASGLFMIQIAHLDALQLVLVGTALEIAAFVFEVPTGVVADTVSRRLSIIVGTALMGLGFIVWGAAPLFVTILVAQVLWGIGTTFISGAWEAWVADESGEPDLGKVMLAGTQADSAGALAGLLSSVAIGAILGLAVPMIVGGVGYLVMAFALAAVMPEAHFSPASRERGTGQAMWSTFREGLSTVRGRPVLLTILAITFIAGAASEAFDRLWQLHLVDDVGLPSTPGLEPIVWIGLISAAAYGLAIVAARVAQRWVATETHLQAARTLLVVDAILMLAIIGFGLVASLAAAATLYLVARTARRLRNPIYSAWINQSLTSPIRATVLSMDAQLDALGQIIGGPLIGAFAVAAGTGQGMVVVGLVLGPSLLLYWRTIRLHGRDVIGPPPVISDSAG